jgi:hypothetical protein
MTPYLRRHSVVDLNQQGERDLPHKPPGPERIPSRRALAWGDNTFVRPSEAYVSELTFRFGEHQASPGE